MRQSIVEYAEDYTKDKILSMILWWNVFDRAGYPKVHMTNWNRIAHPSQPAVVWCEEHVGRRDYFRTGQDVYFTRDEDAINFALRFA